MKTTPFTIYHPRCNRKARNKHACDSSTATFAYKQMSPLELRVCNTPAESYSLVFGTAKKVNSWNPHSFWTSTYYQLQELKEIFLISITSFKS